MNKYSYYNFMFQNGDVALLYNAATDGILVLNSDLMLLIGQYKSNIDGLKFVHMELFDEMCRKGMIVQSENEAETVINGWKLQDNDHSHFYLTILPTLDCNLRCWYCYEEHKKGSIMTDEVRYKICAFVDRLTKDKRLKYLHLDFFGGEPLLSFEKTVFPILEYTNDKCKERGVVLFINFTTNGVLLTSRVRKKLKSLNLEYSPGFQITLDGNREHHNKSRCTSTKKPTYDIIIENIKEALRDGMSVNNRFNYTEANVDSFIDILDDFKDLTKDELKLIHFDFQQVWQENAKFEVREKALKIAGKFFEESHQVRIEKRYNNERCKDDAENQASINYDGLVYKCTARDPKPENAEGQLMSDGNIVWNENYYKRMRVKYGNKACRLCKIFPVCHGGCSQVKLENSDNEECIFHLTEERKEEIVKGRMEYIIKTRERKTIDSCNV